MMSDGDRALRHVRDVLERIGEATTLEGDVLVISRLDTEVRVPVVAPQAGGGGFVFELFVRERLATVRCLRFGFGPTLDVAIDEATERWATSVLPVVSHWLARSQDTNVVSEASLVIRADDSREEYEWRVHLGPVLTGAKNANGEDLLVPVDGDDMLRVLRDDVHPYAARRTAFWIDAYAGRSGESDAHGLCHLENEFWAAGTAALVRWANGWNAPPGTAVAVHQFMLFEAVAPELRRGV